MREPQARRDQREIVVPARPREGSVNFREASVKSRDSGSGRRRRLIGGAAAPVGWFAVLCATAVGAGRLALHQPGTVFGSLLAVGAVTVVSMNALGYQMGRHPAPIFPKVAPRAAAKVVPGKPVAEASPKADSAKPEAVKAEAVKTEAVKTEAVKSETPKPEPVRAEAPKPRRGEDVRSETPPRDTIGEIIRAGETTASLTPKTDRTIAQAQRALVKLGYGPLKADGVLGAGTRTAIEKFERDRKLPVKGEPAGRTMRELVARAGIPQG